MNKGLFFANGKYIARMDADDVSSEDRLEKQFMFFEHDKEVDILGTYINLMGSDRKVNYKTTKEENKIELLIQPPIAHPTAMIKRESMTKYNLYYDKAALYAEDYKLWIDASLCGLSIKNMGEYLCSYRVHTNQVSSKYREKQINTSNQLRIGYAKCFFNSIISGKEWEYLSFILGMNRNKPEQRQKMSLLSGALLDANKKNSYFDIHFFEHFIKQRLSFFGHFK